VCTAGGSTAGTLHCTLGIFLDSNICVLGVRKDTWQGCPFSMCLRNRFLRFERVNITFEPDTGALFGGSMVPPNAQGDCVKWPELRNQNAVTDAFKASPTLSPIGQQAAKQTLSDLLSFFCSMRFAAQNSTNGRGCRSCIWSGGSFSGA
jgi:hypothetical protein